MLLTDEFNGVAGLAALGMSVRHRITCTMIMLLQATACTIDHPGITISAGRSAPLESRQGRTGQWENEVVIGIRFEIKFC